MEETEVEDSKRLYLLIFLQGIYILNESKCEFFLQKLFLSTVCNSKS